MNRSYPLSATIAALLVASCAPMDQQSDKPRSEKDYMTGSRLPAREHSSSADVRGIENKEGIDEMTRGGAIVGAPPKGK